MTAIIYGTVMGVIAFISIVTSLIISKYVLKDDYSEKELKLDIPVESMIELEGNVSDFLEKNNMVPGVPIYEIAKKLNIERGEIVKNQKNQAYLSKPDSNGKMIVTFTDGLTQEEMTFAFAHECAHQVNHDSVPIGRPTGHGKSRREQNADYTAAALLMPIENVYNYLVESDYKNASTRKKVKVIKALCKRYRVSDIIAIRRIREVYAVKESFGISNDN